MARGGTLLGGSSNRLSPTRAAGSVGSRSLARPTFAGEGNAMKRGLIGVALLLTTCTVSTAHGKPAWRTDLASATDEAKRAGKPLFVVFRCQP
jgi:hypothetical protein